MKPKIRGQSWAAALAAAAGLAAAADLPIGPRRPGQ
jgi:hypothetical protein